MRILLPCHAYTDDPKSGLHTVIWNTATALAAVGHEVHVIATFVDLHRQTRETLRERHIFLHHPVQFNTHNLGKATAVVCFLTAVVLRFFYKFDWIYVIDTTGTPFQICKLGARLAVRVLAPRDPLTAGIFEEENWQYDRQRKDAEEQWSGRRRPLWFRILIVLGEPLYRVLSLRDNTKNADIVFCQGKETYGYWKKKIPVALEELPNGIDIDTLDAAPNIVPTQEKFIFLFVGRVAKRKGIFTLISAFQALRRERSDIELWIVGKGSLELLNELRKHTNSDPDHMRYLGEISHTLIGGYLRACHALIDPMIYQGFSTIALEAQACGKPVIISCFGGTKDFVENGVNGFVIDPTDTVLLTDRMRYLCLNPALAMRMGNSMREEVRCRYTWNKVATKITDAFLQNSCSSPPPGTTATHSICN